MKEKTDELPGFVALLHNWWVSIFKHRCFYETNLKYQWFWCSALAPSGCCSGAASFGGECVWLVHSRSSSQPGSGNVLIFSPWSPSEIQIHATIIQKGMLHSRKFKFSEPAPPAGITNIFPAAICLSFPRVLNQYLRGIQSTSFPLIFNFANDQMVWLLLWLLLIVCSI